MDDIQGGGSYKSPDLHQTTPHHGESNHKLMSKFSHNPSWASKLVGIFLVVSAAAILIAMIVGFAVHRQTLVKTNQYQAVFLTNGQVYFGKLRTANDQYISLEDVYYLQQAQQVQQSSSQNSQANLSLVKLGNELHGPEDQMFIARGQILFWENLKDSGKVVQAIKNNQASTTK